MSMSKLQKLNKQHESTWAELHRRLIAMPFNYSELFSSSVGEFVRNVSQSFSSSEGYFTPCLITATAFLVGTASLMVRRDQSMPVNLYSVVIGPPTTGKSVALSKACMEPLITLRDQNDMGNFLLERCTSSAMVKCISDQKKVFIGSPEIYDFLNKLLKNDEEHATGEVQLLCELFSGERTSYRYATECTREIPANTPCSLIGLTQLPYGIRLLCRLDQGSGLLDRFLFLFPLCLRPTPAQTQEAKTNVEAHAETFKSITDIFVEIDDLHYAKKNYSFTDAANAYLDAIDEDFIKELNESLLKGEVTPKSKKSDLIQRVAVCLHVFDHVTSSLLRGRKPRQPSLQVSLQMVKKAQVFVDFAESQKQLVLDFIDSLTDVVVERKKGQPSSLEIKEAVTLLQGPIVTKRAFKQSAPRKVRGVADVEFEHCLSELEEGNFGKVVKAHVSRAHRTIVFLKSLPEADCFQNSSLVNKDEYKRKYHMNCHSGISEGLKTYLIQKQIVKEDFFSTGE